MLALSILGLTVAVLLGWSLFKRLASDHIEQIMEGRRATSRLVSRGELIDGNKHIPISLALGELAIYYENQSMQASLDLDWIEEVEYRADLITGRYAGEERILMLRCFDQAFEFLVPSEALPQWQMMLPAHGVANPADTLRGDTSPQARKDQSRADDDGWPTRNAATA